MLNKTTADLNALINRLGEGLSEPVAYDTAWIARVPNFPNVKEPAFPEALDWLRRHQCEEGWWGSSQPVNAHSNTISTLAAIISLLQWQQAEDKPRIIRGVEALRKLAPRLSSELQETVGFEMLLPNLVNEIISMNLELPPECSAVYQTYAQKTAKKIQLITQSLQENKEPNSSSSWWFSLEMLGNNVANIPDSILGKNGSVASSPAVTAYLLRMNRLAGKDIPAAGQYLKNLIAEYMGGAPHSTSFDEFELAFGLDYLIKAGISAGDIKLKPAMEKLAKFWHEKGGKLGSLSYEDVTQVGLRVLSEAGYDVDILKIDSFDARELSQWIEENMSSDYVFTDKWHFSPLYAVSRAVFALCGVKDALASACVAWIIEHQNMDGGWGYFNLSTPEETAYASLALCFWQRQGNQVSYRILSDANEFLKKESQSSIPLWICKVLYSPRLIVSAAIIGAQYALQHSLSSLWEENQITVAEEPPSIETWHGLSRLEISNQIRHKRLSMMLTMDGTRRHQLLSQLRQGIHPSEIRKFKDDVKHYASSGAHAAVQVYDLIFSHGIETLMTAALFPLNYLRGRQYILKCLESSEAFFKEPFLSLYKKWNIKIRLYGDYDIAFQGNIVKDKTYDLNSRLIELTPEGDRLLLMGYCIDTFAKEEKTRAITLYKELGRAPTEVELRKACYPYGPEKIDIYVGAGRMTTSLVLPPLLGPTDLYFLSHLEFDLTEKEIRNILYDYLFCRNASFKDYLSYAPETLKIMKNYYDKHSHCVLGLGEVVGHVKWYAHHSCHDFQPAHQLLLQASNLEEKVN